ncbi:MAG TPA: MFS transporter [Microthrixaceae bacterium]|nr:MFS transporter [Microthrixaceae bacterium]HMT23930.1 MFS transporter [Microthrixaceae bacterium]HMT61555.1 MFS transporter [Microthrixaceae bacterium]
MAPRLLVELGHRTATATSQLLIPRPLTFAVAGVAAGYLVARIGVRVIAAVGTALVVASLVAMSLVSTHLSIPLVLAAIAVSGLGMGAVQPALSTTVANAVDDVDLGVAGATIQMVAQIATSLGMNLLDSLEAGMADRVGAAHAYSNAYLIGAAITAMGVAAAWTLPRRPARAATR